MSSSQETKDAATKSTSFSTPNFISCLSISVSAGKDNFVPGMLTPFLDLMFPVFLTRHTISSFFSLTTSSSINPSSNNIVEPTLTSSTKPLYVIETLSVSPSTSLVVIENSYP